jgi:hypothetical protein
MAGYISSFKKFMKSEEKKTDEIGANPQMVQEEDAVADPIPNDPALKSQYDTLQTKKNELLALQKQVVMKQDELNKLQTTYDNAASTKQKEEQQKAEAAKAAAPTT